MPELRAASWLRIVESTLGLLGSASLQGSVCLSSGAVLAALGVLLGRSLHDLSDLLRAIEQMIQTGRAPTLSSAPC
jgi:hypothetical protein